MNHTEDDGSSREIACFCNNVSKETVRHSIVSGAHSLEKIYDSCGAGTGPCGGTCRDLLLNLIAEEKKGVSKETQEAIPEALIHGISLFNRHYFWECHEVLEHEWLDEVGPKKKFYQGIIQASAAFYHVLNANPKGVIKLAQDAQEKLQPYSPLYLKVPVSELLDSLKDFHTQAKEILGGSLSGFEYDRIPKIKLTA